MKTVRMSIVLASMAGAATLFLGIPVSMSASPGMEWDYFNTHTGEPITTGNSYQGTSLGSTVGLGQGFDQFNTGYGVKIERFEQAYMGNSTGSKASDGWDVFQVKEGDPVP